MDPTMMGGQKMGDQPPVGEGQMGMGDQMPQEEMRGNLADLADKINGKFQEVDTIHSTGQVKLAEKRIKELKIFFEKLEQAGVNLSDPESVRGFFDKLYENNPDIYELLIPVLDDILGPAEQGEQGEQEGEQSMEVGP